MSGQFGIKERAAATLLNSSLVPVMESFLTGVQHAMEQIGLAAELLVVRGDGRLVHRDAAAAAPATTVCSGPAASALFGAAAVADTGIVVDVGGTTTDSALVARGQPLVAEHGSRIGGWHTHVLAVESAILTFLMRRELDLDLSTFLARRRHHYLVEVILRLKAPLVGVGAAARLLLPAVASALEVEAIFPPHLEVGNALGAARLALTCTDVP